LISLTLNSIHETAIEYGSIAPPPTLSGKVVSDCFFTLSDLFNFSESTDCIEIFEDNRGRAWISKINWDEAEKYVKAVCANAEPLFRFPGGNRGDNANEGRSTRSLSISSSNAIPPSLQRVIAEAESTEPQERRVPIQPTLSTEEGITHGYVANEPNHPPNPEHPMTGSAADDSDLRGNSTLVIFPHRFQDHLAVKYPWGAPLPVIPLAPTNKTGGYTDITHGHVKMYTGGEVPYKSLLLTRLKKFMETQNLDVKVRIPCKHVTVAKCTRVGPNPTEACPDKVHFAKVYNEVSDITYGDCSYLNGCYNMNSCVYLHYREIRSKKPKTFFEKMKLSSELTRDMVAKGDGDFRQGVVLTKQEVKPPAKVSKTLPHRSHADLIRYSFRPNGSMRRSKNLT
jgi:hypothetical protein